MILTIRSGADILWKGEAPELMMGVGVGDRLDVPGDSKWDGVRATVRSRRVSLADYPGSLAEVTLELTVEVGE